MKRYYKCWIPLTVIKEKITKTVQIILRLEAASPQEIPIKSICKYQKTYVEINYLNEMTKSCDDINGKHFADQVNVYRHFSLTLPIIVSALQKNAQEKTEGDHIISTYSKA